MCVEVRWRQGIVDYVVPYGVRSVRIWDMGSSFIIIESALNR